MKIMTYIMTTAFVLAATVVPAAAAELDGRSNGATDSPGWGATHGVPAEALNAAEMAAVVGEFVQIFVKGDRFVVDPADGRGTARITVIGAQNATGPMVVIHIRNF